MEVRDTKSKREVVFGEGSELKISYNKAL